MGSPIDRTNKTALDTNLVNGVTSDAPKLKASNDTVYNYVDTLNSGQDSHAGAATLAHPDGSVTTAKLANGSVTTAKIADGAVTAAKVADGSLTAGKFVAGALSNETQNGLNIVTLQADTVSRGINVKFPPAPLVAAKGDWNGTIGTDDTTAIRAIIQHAIANGIKTIIYPSGSYKVSGDNPCGLPKVPPIVQSGIEYNLNFIGNNAHFQWFPENETDEFAFVGYLRSSRWQDFKVTVVPPSGMSNYGDIFSTKFGIAGKQHEFSCNVLSNIWIDGSLRHVFNFDSTDELQTHDDLTRFENISALGYRRFYYTTNSNSVALTFDDCKTLLNVDGAIDFHIAGPWAGGLRVVNHHFTIMDCDGATFFKCEAPSHPYATIYCERSRTEVRETATNWKYFDMTTGVLHLNDITSVNYPIYSSSNVYGIVRDYSRVTFKDSSAVYTPINVIGVEAPGFDSAQEVLEFDHCSFVNGDISDARQSYPLINYCRPDGLVFTTRYHAMASTYNFGNIVIKYSTGRWGDLTRWLDSVVISNGREMVVDTQSKKKTFSYKNVAGATVNYIATKVPVVMPFDIVIENIEYITDNYSLIDAVKCVFPNGERADFQTTVSGNITSMIDPVHPLYLSAGVKLQLHVYSGGVEYEETTRGVTASQMRITYRLPMALSEFYNVIVNEFA